LGAIDVGQLLNVAQTVNNASREGARRASRNTVLNTSEIEEAVETYLANCFPGLTPEELNAALTVNIRDSGGTSINGDLTSIPTGDSISVEVVFQYDAVRWTAGFAGASDQSLQITTTMRRE
jgi:Flp pilus assembly protein TadG